MASDKISITGERIRELYEDLGYSQKEFADFLGISTAQLRRYEKDPDQPIRSDLLIVMAKHFHVSVDYLLGLTPVTKNNHEMEHLHLTEAACEKLIRGEVSGDTLSRMMEHEKFGQLIQDVSAYFDDSKVEGINIQNEMLALSASIMQRHAHETKHPERVLAAAQGLKQTEADPQEIQLSDIETQFDSILRDTKKKIDENDPAVQRKAASAEMVARVAQAVEDARFGSGKQLTTNEQIDQSADMIVNKISKETGVGGTPIRVLKSVFSAFFRRTGKEKDN